MLREVNSIAAKSLFDTVEKRHKDLVGTRLRLPFVCSTQATWSGWFCPGLGDASLLGDSWFSRFECCTGFDSWASTRSLV
jgi:hypothetical protein